MSEDFASGLAIGLGVGWLNATMLGVPGWTNILAMFAFAIVGALDHGTPEAMLS